VQKKSSMRSGNTYVELGESAYHLIYAASGASVFCEQMCL
jgi:hypothetical protein